MAASGDYHLRVLQANLNHCRVAQELWFHSLAELGIGLAAVAEPYRVPETALVSTCGSAMLLRREEPNSPPLSLVGSGKGFVGGLWGEVVVVGCYFSPNRSLAAFEAFLGGVEDLVSRAPTREVLVLGDFNAWSQDWGSSRSSARGRALADWAEGQGLRLLNRGSEPTCVRHQGESIVDLSFATPGVAQRVSEWRVMDEETWSDHRYILVTMAMSLHAGCRPRPSGESSPRWTLRRLDPGMLGAAILAVGWAKCPADPCGDAEAEAAWFRGVMTDISDVSMPRAGPPLPRRTAYWWTGELTTLRERCLRARRRYTAARPQLGSAAVGGDFVPFGSGGFFSSFGRSGGSFSPPSGAAGDMSPPSGGVRGMVDRLWGGYRVKRESLRLAIWDSKKAAWVAFLESLDKDPWGRPYRWVRKKFRKWAPPLTETLDPRFLAGVVDALFPVVPGEVARPPDADHVPRSAEEMGVTEKELEDAMKRLGAKNTAPGPDGVHGRIWVAAHSALGARLRRLFDSCLRTGVFPPAWKTARMVLLKKEGRPEDQPSAYRPICLLDEAGKLFERVIANRLVHHLSRTGPDLAANQFGFRGGRSTIDAIDRVRSLSEEAVSRGGVALAVSLDIANAFNTLPWNRIREALEFHKVPLYLRRIIGAYLRDRWIEYPGRDGAMRRRRAYCGVPQGSVLGPILWNLGYDSILRAALPTGLSVTCYADDTLVIVRGVTWRETAILAEVGVQHVVRRITGLGLRVDLAKTEALWFHAPRQRPPRTSLKVGGTEVEVGSQIKYLGLILDSRWRFAAHLDRMVPRIMGAASALGRLLPNIGGPGTATRCLYLGVVRSMALYGAPIWARELRASAHNRSVLRRVGRRIAIRVVRAYRTISEEAAFVLAGVPPWDLLAEMYRDTYYRARGLRQGPGTLEKEDDAVEMMKRQAWRSVLLRWQRQLVERPAAAQGIVGAIRPCFDAWLDSGVRGLTYQVTQVLTGHGCFGEYLERIGRERTACCYHCGAARDTAQHTLEECRFFEPQRRVLRDIIGDDLSLPTIIEKMVGSEEHWDAVASFCERVMSQKEDDERKREIERGGTHAPRRARGHRALHVPALPGADGGGNFVAPVGRAPRRAGADTRIAR